MTQDDKDLEAALAPYLAAARRAETPPRSAMLNAILADAADVSAERRARESTAAAVQLVRRRAGLPCVLASLGGWPSVAALGAVAALGFVAGLGGVADFGSDYVWDPGIVEDAGPLGVDAFFDLAAVGG